MTGDTVNTATRSTAAAPVGGVLIGESTALAVAEIADLGDPVPLELKGKAEPVPARVVLGLLAEPSREKAMGGLWAPTVGRANEVDTLTAALDRARDGIVERWLIVAPPGVGKSRLLAELARGAGAPGARGGRPDVVTVRGRARAGSVAPFEPVAELLRSVLGKADQRALAAELLLAALAARGMAQSRARVVLEMCLGLLRQGAESAADDRTDERVALFAGWMDGLDALAAKRAQLWLIEDVHWAAADLLAFLDFATDRSVAAGRLIVATARPSLLETTPAWSEDEKESARRVLRLDTLAEFECA